MTNDLGGGRPDISAGPQQFSRWLILVFSFVFIGLSVLPDASSAQSYRFGSVSVEGNERIEDGTVLSYAGIARGQSVSAGELNAAYQRILGSGLFESVEMVPQGGRLVIKVTEFPTINLIGFDGNRRLKDDVLATLVQSQSRRVFNPSLAERDAQRIADAYVQEGRLAARVSPKVIRRSGNRVDLVFEVFEGGVVEIQRLGFVGNRAYSDRRLRRVLGTKQAGLLRRFIKSDTLIEDRIEFDKQVLQDFYQSRGYVDFRTNAVNAELTRERDGFLVTFNVQEGQQFRVGEVTTNSDLPDVDIDLFQSALKLRTGIVYSPTLVENDIARLERLAVREGLNFVRVEPRINRNDRDLTLDVEFVLTRGPKIFVERIDIEGNTTTVDQVVRRQFQVVEGDPFNPRQIRESAERIRALGFFSSAEVNAREGSTPDQVVVDVDVEEQPTGSLSFGASYSTAGGFGAIVKFSERNFLGRGQRLSFAISSGIDNREYSFNFAEPAFLGRNLTFGVNVSYRETNNQNSTYDTAIGQFQPYVNFPISENGRLTLRYATQVSDMTDPDDDTGDLIRAETERGELWNNSVGYTLSYDTRRTGLNPNAGVLLEFSQDLGGLGGDDKFIKTTARAVAQTRVWNEEVTLRAAVEGGVLNYSKGSSRVIDRFRMGSSVMRGFEPGGIGPRERNGSGVDDALGGNQFVVARFEAEFPLGLPEEYGISGGVFYDIGSLWGLDKSNSDTIYEDFTVRQTIGVSIFWNTPIGPLRFNFSEPLEREKHDEVQNFDLTISTSF